MDQPLHSYRTSAIFLTLAIALLCNGNLARGTEILIAPKGTLDWLGKGYDSETRYPKEKCVAGEQLILGNRFLDLSFYNALSREDIYQKSYGKLSGGVNFIIFGGKVSVSVTQTYAETNSRSSSILALDYVKHRVLLENRSYNSLGQSMLARTPMVQRENCGDQFIHSAKLGAKLFLVANLEFKTSEDYQRYVQKVTVRVLFWKKTFTNVDEFKKIAKNGVFSLKVDQFGGSTARFQQILAQNPTYCPVETIEACLDTRDLLFDYLFSEDGFVQDFDQDLEIISFTTEPYIESGHLQLQGQKADIDDPGYSDEEARLLQHLYHNMELAEKIKNLLQTDGINQSLYTQKLEAVNRNIALLEAALAFCEQNQNYNSCKQSVDSTIASLESVVI